MTCGAPQGSQVRPFVWNVMYDVFLRMDPPAGATIVGFADDALVVCAADDDVRILELRINETILWRVKRSLDSRSLEMALGKTEALLVTDRRAFNSPQIVLEWADSKSAHSAGVKYLARQPVLRGRNENPER